MEQKKGQVHLYVGDGKGKTTCAAGLALRALGAGRRVLFCQFLKARPSGELAGLERLGAQLLRAKHIEKFTFQMNGEELREAGERHRQCLARVAAVLAAGAADLVVLDEVVDAVNCGFLPLEGLTAALAARAPHVEVVLTGRNPPGALVDLADYHTDFVCRAHPYRQGLEARPGIEY